MTGKDWGHSYPGVSQYFTHHRSHPLFFPRVDLIYNHIKARLSFEYWFIYYIFPILLAYLQVSMCEFGFTYSFQVSHKSPKFNRVVGTQFHPFSVLCSLYLLFVLAMRAPLAFSGKAEAKAGIKKVSAPFVRSFLPLFNVNVFLALGLVTNASLGCFPDYTY